MSCNSKKNSVKGMSSEAPVAQLDRASDYGSEGCKFESCRVRHLKTAERQFFLYPLDWQFHHLFNYGSTPCFKVVHCFTQKNSSPLKAYFVYFSGFKAFNRKLECSFS